MQLFVANKEQPPEITSILRANRSKLLRFLKDFTTVEKGKFAARTNLSACMHPVNQNSTCSKTMDQLEFTC